ncbi:Yip1 domain-containing protein [Natronoarchaeum philippinense]|uniref:Yip1 domain-containing protein n=1 Tax=Natronoarchaeum philippinense TaxID=558529 RepID=A0A285NWZ5_NATPI|nr:YIP1 family protein [Natronoarchaeum philippinense]SNZ12406.1 Yip1 domain-containing protein [Natronoarchaeum philippinense]
MVDAARALRQFLLSPAAFFEERPPARTFPIAAGLVVLLAVCLTGGILALESILEGAIDATVTMDNPDRPPEPFCDGEFGESGSSFDDGCDEPRTIERDAGALVAEAMRSFLWIGMVVPFVMWFLGGVVLFGAGRLAGGDPSLGGAFALAGWAAVPELARLVVGIGSLWVVLSNTTITDFEQADVALDAALAPVTPWLALASLLTIGWQWYILSAGLSKDADLSRAAAGVAVAVPLGFVGLLGVL